jgi:Fe-S oxidoreductase
MSDRIVFWYGCNVVRHGDIVHSCMALLDAVGIEATAVGGPQYCCGTTRDEDLNAAESMAKRTVGKFNQIGEDKVVTWCPSCHRHMGSFMSGYNDPRFEVAHFAQLLHEHRDRLAPLLVHRVERRVLLHQHFGFHEVDVNPLVRSLLALVPGLVLVDCDYSAPAHMCSGLAAVPAAVKDVNRRTIDAVRSTGAQDVVTVFHSCQRMLCALEASEGFRVVNWVTVLARALGHEFPDEYGHWKNAPDEAGIVARIGPERIGKVGETFFRKAMLPEISTKPVK